MSIAVVCTSFKEWGWVWALQEQVRKAGMEFVHLASARSWHGGEEDPSGAWKFPDEASQRNMALARAWMKDYAWAITLDADEVLTVEDFGRLMAFLAALPRDKDVVLAGRMHTYFKDVAWRVDPPETHAPVLAVRAHCEPFRDNRCVVPGIGMERWDGGILHHFSWARPEEEIQRKLRTFSHAPEIRPGWYEDVWKRWTPEMRNFHPLGDGTGYRAVCASEAPQEIREHWDLAVGRKEREA